jgi:hypothetical protein
MLTARAKVIITLSEENVNLEIEISNLNTLVEEFWKLLTKKSH